MLERFRQIATHVTDERIQTFRTIERDRRDAVSFSNLNVLVHLASFEFRLPLVHVSVQAFLRIL
jgi:hypothetical protein